MTTRRVCVLGLLGALWAGAAPAPALVPQEVLVVVNANAEGSEALGKYYCLARNILEDRVVVLRTTSAPIVGRGEYDKNVRAPIRKFLLDNGLKGKIKCLALMWGVPVRVLGSELTAEQRELMSAYKTVKDRLHRRIAVNAELLQTVGVAFPRARTEGPRPVGELFAPDAVGSLGEYRKFETIAGRISSELKKRESAAAGTKDRARRQIALRQCAAIRLDTFGAQDLMEHLPGEAVPGVPDRAQLAREIKSLQARQAKLAAEGETPETVPAAVEVMLQLHGLVAAHKHAERQIRLIDTRDEDASVDSELALLWEETDKLRGARPNPMYWRLGNATTRPANVPGRIIMAARIDGPTAKDALRIIKDSVAVEKVGLEGRFYIDAGGKYEHYEVNLKNLAELVSKHTKLQVVLDTKKTLFARDSCPDAALYVGWYGLQEYVPAFTWVRGAVGYHIASLEAVHLRAPASKEWCVKMIQDGVAATFGAVNEPYLGAFPLPQDFFALLLTGRFTLAECYWRTIPAVSWRLTLVADPLYNPFRLKPHLSVHALPAQMVGRTPAGAQRK